MKYVINYIVIATLVLITLPMRVCAEDIMYWDSDFDPISLLSIASLAQTRQGSATVTLCTSGNAVISADKSAAAQLSCATDSLITEYKLTFDNVGGTTGVGTGEGGGSEWQLYNVFLETGTEGDVTYVIDDNDVQVTLWVRASNNTDEVADSDTYNAIQTLTVSWIGP